MLFRQLLLQNLYQGYAKLDLWNFYGCVDVIREN